MEIIKYSTYKSSLERKLANPIYKFCNSPTACNFSKIPKNFITAELAKMAVENNGECIGDIPKEILDDELCKLALKNMQRNPARVLLSIPSEFRDTEYRAALSKYGQAMNEQKQIQYEACENSILHSVENNIPDIKKFYYITDIHLEHQLPLAGKECGEIYNIIYEKLTNMIRQFNMNDSFLLLGGDVSNSLYISNIFYLALYDALEQSKNVKIISVLGNHELWDDASSFGISKTHSDSEIVAYHKSFSQYFGSKRTKNILTILENDVWIWYKDREYIVIPEREFMDASVEDLDNILSKATVIILGGIGYSGFNQVMNADKGLYRNRIDNGEDIRRTLRFKKVYDKLKLCASRRKVIVLTHMQKENWSDEPYNEGWIYINGHTHQNIKEMIDGADILSDNQLGYDTKSVWNLKYTSFQEKFDLFTGLKNGIYEITDKDYNEFLYSKGVNFKERNLKVNENIYMLKNEDVYMFILETLLKNGKASICLLEGWKKNRLARDIGYYYRNLPIYAKVVSNSSLSNYQKLLKEISDEVKKIGGSGKIHGFIVDIDFYNHVMYDPDDNSITIYFATSTNSGRVVYKNLNNCLKKSRLEVLGRNREQLLSKYNSLIKKKELPILTGKKCRINTKKRGVKAKYRNSNVMKKFEYLLDSGIVRVWEDEILPKEIVGEVKTTRRMLEK